MMSNFAVTAITTAGLIGFAYAGHQTASAVTAESAAEPTPTQLSVNDPTGAVQPNKHSARVVSCAIRFPLDSVKFPEDQVLECLKSTRIEAVSYIHVIATASSSGSGRHNLYLSTRRAGAIEAFLNNRFPHIQVHAFGGGVNPKFGKLARIFIVEHQNNADDMPGVQVASIATPDIIERTKIKTITKTEFIPEPKHDINFSLHTGPAQSELSEDVYNFVGFSLTKSLSVEPLGYLKFGLRHSLLQSNESVDINSSNALVGRDWYLANLYGQELFYEQWLELGQIVANGRSAQWGTTATLGLQNQTFRFFLTAEKSNYLASFGTGLGIRM